MTTNSSTRRKSFQYWLRLAMARANITQAQLARALGVHRATISLYLAGQRRPTPDRIPDLASALSLSESHLDELKRVLHAGEEAKA